MKNYRNISSPKLLSILFVCLSAYNAIAQQSATILSDIEKDIHLPAHYIAFHSTDSIIIDGRDDEDVWDKTTFSNPFIDIEGTDIPKFETKVKMLWDNNFLYIFARLQEPHVWGTLTKRDAIIYYDNDFEVFIDPTDDTYDYTEIEVNALNTVWDLKLNKPYRMRGRANSFYNIEGLKTAVNIQGTLNNPDDTDTCWSVEIAIPMKVVMRAFRGHRLHPDEGDFWRINFSRVQWQYDIKNGAYSRKTLGGKLLPEYNWVWSPQYLINMHVPERWGYLEFSNQKPGSDKSKMKIDKLIDKQVAYTLIRKVKYGNLKYLLESKAGEKQKMKTFSIQDQEFECTFMKTNFGFEWFLTNLSNDSNHIINESGQFKSY